MVTYGSYTPKSENLVFSLLSDCCDGHSCLFCCSMALSSLFYFLLEQREQVGLLCCSTRFPVVFSQIPFGYMLAPLFFLLVMLAALTSEVSAMEPSVAYLMDKFGWSRKKCVTLVGVGAFLIGIPCALSHNLLADVRPFGHSIVDGLIYLGSDILIPIGGLAAALLIGWGWKGKKWMEEITQGAHGFIGRNPWFRPYLTFCVKYAAPLLIGIVLFQSIIS